MVEEQNDLLIISISRIEELEHRVNDLEHRINGTKFLSTYQDWIEIFMNTIMDQLREGKRVERVANNALLCLRNNLTLTDEENKYIEKLTGLLESVIDMTLDDIELLHEVKSKGNVMFHRNKQDIREAKIQLDDLIPDEVQIYKPPIKKVLAAIDKWRPSCS